MIPRRGLLAGLGALLAAPAIIRTPGLLMPVRRVLEPQEVPLVWITRTMSRAEFDRTFVVFDEAAEVSDLAWGKVRTNVLDGHSNWMTQEKWTRMGNAVTDETQSQDQFTDFEGPVWKFRA